MKKHFLLLALAAICSLSVGAVEYASTADFYAEANSDSPTDVHTFLAQKHYTVVAPDSKSPSWDAQQSNDGGLAMTGESTTSFWVKANQKVTIKVGTLNGDQNPREAILTMNGGTRIAIAEGSETSYTTTEETQFVITTYPATTAYWAWNRIHKITISDMSPKTVNFNTQGGTPETIEPLTEAFFGAGITLPSVTKSGYIFDGWYTAATGGTFAGNAGANYKPADNCTLHAHWAGFAEKANFYDAAMSSSQPDIATYLSDKHYTCSGSVYWDNQPTVYSDRGLGMDANRTLSFWVKANQKVTITTGTIVNYDGGTITLIQYDINGNQIGNPSYISANTTTNPYETNQVTEFRLTTQNVSGSWNRIHNINIEALAYTITFNPGEGSGEMNPVPKKENETYLLITPSPDYFTPPTGYHFKEWSCSYDSKTYAAGVSYTMPASDVTFTAIWEEDSEVEYTVEYANGGGTWTGVAPTEGNHKAGETFALPASSVVERTGYQFASWNDGTNTFAAEATYTMPAKEVTLTAQWNQLYTVTYNAGDVTYSGTLPTQDSQIEGASFKVAAGIKCQGYAFKGWKAEATTYQPNDDFTMPASAVEFVAQWEAVTVPVVTDLEIKNAANEIVPLSWNIPGVVDITKPVQPLCLEQSGTTSNIDYANGVVSADYSAPAYGQQGVAFNIPATTGFEWVSIKYEGTVSSGTAQMWIGATEGDASKHAYWQFEDPTDMPLPQVTMQQSTRKVLDDRYWADPYYCPRCAAGDISGLTMKQIVVMANVGAGGGSGSFAISDVRYHVKDANDQGVAKVVLVRKQGENAATSVSDADKVFELSSDLAFSFTDKDSKTSGRYWYTVFCLDEDGNYSAGTSVSYDLVVKEKHNVTYELGTGVTGVAPTQEPQVFGQTFIVAAGTGFKKQGFKFSKWNDGTKDYTPGEEYTMPDNAVQFTPVWEAVVVPAVTNLSGNGVNDVVTLSWNTPGLMDIANTTVNQAQDCSWSLSQCSWTKVNDNKELEVSYTFSDNQYNGPALMFASNRTDIDSVHFEYKGSGSSIALEFTPFLYGTNSDAHERYAGNPSSSDITNVTDWTPATLVPVDPLWGIGVTYNHQPISSVSFYVAQHEIGTTNFTLNLRNIMVYSNTQTPVKEVVVLRKAGSAITSFDDPDAVELASGLLNNLVDDEEKEPNETYYYAVYAVDFDGNYSEAQTFSYKNVVIATYAVAFDANGATGTVPTMANQQEGAQFTLPDKGNLAKGTDKFTGWNNGTSTYHAGDTYTMPNHPVTFTAQWNVPITLPATLDKSNYTEKHDGVTFWGDNNDYFNFGAADYGSTDRYVEWLIKVEETTTFTVKIDVSCSNGHNYFVTVGDKEVSEGGQNENKGVRTLSSDFTLSEGVYTLRLHGNVPWTNSRVRYVQLSVPCTEVAITTQPVGATIGLGDITTLSVAASGSAPFAYQWQVSDTEGGEYANITSDGNAPTLTIRPSVEGTKYYRCYVSNECSNATSMAVAVTAEDRGFLLDEWDENISATIDAYYGSASKINLQRTLSSASLNTLCLPFAMSAEQLATYNMNAELYRFTGATVSQSGDDVTLTLNFVDATEILAGYPYLIRPSVDVVNPVIEGSSITVKAPKAEGDENVLFQGIYAPTTLIANDENNLFVGANSTLFWPDEDATMPGLRAYFQILTPAAQVATRAQMKFNQHVITDLNLVRPARAEHYKYIDRNGRLIIVRDGKAYGVLGSQLAR